MKDDLTNKILASCSDKRQMLEAITRQTFYIIVFDCVDYKITFQDNGLPCIYSSLAEAYTTKSILNSLIGNKNSGEVVKCAWNGGSTMDLFELGSEKKHIFRGYLYQMN